MLASVWMTLRGHEQLAECDVVATATTLAAQSKVSKLNVDFIIAHRREHDSNALPLPVFGAGLH